MARRPRRQITNKIYVVDSSSKNLLAIDGVTNELTVRPLDFEPCSAAVDPAVSRVYVSHCSFSRISIIMIDGDQQEIFCVTGA